MIARLAPLAALLLMLLFPPAAGAQTGDWVVLGEQSVGFDVDRDYIRVDRSDAQIARLRLEAEGNDIFVFEVRVIHANNHADSFRIDQLLRAGGRGLDIDLGGRRGFVREIELTYRARPGFAGRASVRVLGDVGDGRRPDPPPSRAPAYSGGTDGFEELDSQRVNLRNDQFILHPQQGPAAMDRIMIMARGNPIFIRRVTVAFDRGGTREFRIGELVEPGATTRPIELAPQDGAIREVVVLIRPREEGGVARLILLGSEGPAVGGGPSYPRPPLPDPRERPYGGDPYQAERMLPPPSIGPDGLPHGRWQLLGSERAGFRSNDRDVIRVGPAAGRLGKIALRVTGNAVFVREISIVYASGEVDNFPVNKEIPEGTLTPALLLGGNRFVERIEISHQSRRDGRNWWANVEVFGERSDGAGYGPRPRF